MAGGVKSRPNGVRAAKDDKTDKIIVRRNSNKIYGVFIDGVGLDRASRRLKRKVDLSALLKSLTAGSEAKLARYYTLLPQEDDSRHRAFLDAVANAGLNVFSKRLPPKGIERQVAVDVEMSVDMLAFALGHETSNLSLVTASGQFSISQNHPNPENHSQFTALSNPNSKAIISPHPATENELRDIQIKASEIAEQEVEIASHNNLSKNRVIVVVCPSRELAYPLALCKHFGADTISADFGQFIGGDLLKSAAKWIDLSSSQTIWK